MDNFLTEFQGRIIASDRYDWSNHLAEYGTLRTYRQFKIECTFEPYLDLDISREAAQMFTRLRARLLRFEANTGRWAKPPIPYEQRLCKLCNSAEIEDEAHVLFRCPVWACYRYQLRGYGCMADNDLVALMESTDEKFITDLNQFLKLVLFEKSEMLAVLG